MSIIIMPCLLVASSAFCRLHTAEPETNLPTDSIEGRADGMLDGTIDPAQGFSDEPQTFNFIVFGMWYEWDMLLLDLQRLNRGKERR